MADHVTLKVAFDEDPDLRELDGAQYLARLARAAETILNAEDYAKHILDLALKRGLIRAGEVLTSKAYDGADPTTAADQLEAARAQFDQLAKEVPAPVAMVDWPALDGYRAPPRTFGAAALDPGLLRYLAPRVRWRRQKLGSPADRHRRRL